MSDSQSTSADESFAEIDAMRSVAEALKDLSVEARGRVLRWATDRFPIPGIVPSPSVARAKGGPAGVASEQSTDDLATLYGACHPDTDAEKALVVAYWIQEHQHANEVDAQNVNTELKHLGHGVGNITRAFDNLKQTRPQLVIQLKKAGTTKQARKTYRVTLEGKHAVEHMRNRDTESA